MKMTGEQRIAAPRERVWAALNDPAVLRRCIPGCQSLEQEGGDKLKATVEIKIGPIGARFNGTVTLSDLKPPESYTITGQGNGGTVGSAKGGAKVRLAAAGEETVLTYEVDAEVGGRLAQLGGPIIDATAKQLAGKFFNTFGDVVAGGDTAQTEPAPTEATDAPVGRSATPPIAGPHLAPPAQAGSIWGWIAAIAVGIITGFYLGVYSSTNFWLALVIILVVVSAAAGYEAGKRRGGGA